MWLQHHQMADNLLVKSNLRPLLSLVWETLWKWSDHCVMQSHLSLFTMRGHLLCPVILISWWRSPCAPCHLIVPVTTWWCHQMLSNVTMTSSHHATCQQIRSAQGKHIEITLMLQRDWWLGCVRVTLHVSIVWLSAKSQAFSHPVSLAAVTKMRWMDYIVTQE